MVELDLGGDHPCSVAMSGKRGRIRPWDPSKGCDKGSQEEGLWGSGRMRSSSWKVGMGKRRLAWPRVDLGQRPGGLKENTLRGKVGRKEK